MKNFLRANYLLLGVNVIFWFFIAFYFSFFKFAEKSDYLILKVLLFFEPLVFICLFIGVIKKIKIIYFVGLFFLFINAVLSVTDEVGLLDIFSLFLNMVTFISFLSIRNRFVS